MTKSKVLMILIPRLHLLRIHLDTFQKYNDHFFFYLLETIVLHVPEVTDCVRVGRDLHVKLFYKGVLLPLP